MVQHLPCPTSIYNNINVISTLHITIDTYPYKIKLCSNRNRFSFFRIWRSSVSQSNISFKHLSSFCFKICLYLLLWYSEYFGVKDIAVALPTNLVSSFLNCRSCFLCRWPRMTHFEWRWNGNNENLPSPATLYTKLIEVLQLSILL